LARLYAEQADILYMLTRLRDALMASEQAERIARFVGGDQCLVQALMIRGLALCMLGRLTEATHAMSAAVTVADVADTPYFPCWALVNLGLIHQEGGAFTGALQTTERAVQLAERHGLRIVLAAATMQRGWLAFLTGKWAVARRDLEQAAFLCREGDPFWVSVYALLALGSLCLAEGADAEALQFLEQAEQLRQAGDLAHAQRRDARDLLAGRAERVRARLAPLLAPGVLEHDPTALQVLLAQAQLELGDVADAAVLISGAVARARAQGMRVLLGEALRVAALVAIRQGRWDEAACALQEGLTLARQLGYPYGEALLLQVAGALATQTDQPEEASARLAEALAILRRLGARADLLAVPGLVSCWY
jgi:tetratricopeptide (TPR) repeat protein